MVTSFCLVKLLTQNAQWFNRVAFLVTALSCHTLAQDTPVGKYRGPTAEYVEYIEVILERRSEGVLKFCAFSYDFDDVAVYRFEWSHPSKNRLVPYVEVRDLRLASRFDGLISGLEIAWHGSHIDVTVSGKRWKQRATLYNVKQWERAERLVEEAQSANPIR